MREIKFRYVCKDVTGNIFTFIKTIRELEQAKLNVNTYGLIDEILARNEYTGLKDKNGKEIYEGDIVEWECGDRGIIEFNYSAFIIKWIEPTEEEWDYMNEFIESGGQTIIGNIYENPGLLQHNDTHRHSK